jgi:hypothetical protein
VLAQKFSVNGVHAYRGGKREKTYVPNALPVPTNVNCNIFTHG